MKEMEDTRTLVKKHTENKLNIKCLQRLKNLRRKKMELQKVKEKLADTVF